LAPNIAGFVVALSVAIVWLFQMQAVRRTPRKTGPNGKDRTRTGYDQAVYPVRVVSSIKHSQNGTPRMAHQNYFLGSYFLNDRFQVPFVSVRRIVAYIDQPGGQPATRLVVQVNIVAVCRQRPQRPDTSVPEGSSRSAMQADDRIRFLNAARRDQRIRDPRAGWEIPILGARSRDKRRCAIATRPENSDKEDGDPRQDPHPHPSENGPRGGTYAASPRAHDEQRQQEYNARKWKAKQPDKIGQR